LTLAADYRAADAKLAALYQGDNENIWYSIAFAENLEHLGRESEAELVYRRLLDIFPGDYVLSMRLVQVLKLGGHNQSALMIARTLENEHPNDKQVYFELSEIYRALNRPALRMMAEAEFHRIAGNPDQAIKLYDQVLNLPDTDLATQSMISSFTAGCRYKPVIKVPPHYIREFIVSRNRRIVMEAYRGKSILRNPYLAFEIPGRKGDLITISWLDDRGNSESATAKVR
jgi:tetratricopeptide (TPR) repeat protein